MEILRHITSIRQSNRKGLAVLIDPDKISSEQLPGLLENLSNSRVDLILVGGSLLMKDHFERVVSAIRQMSDLPLALFPGSVFQIHPDADAILLLSLISGRNPEMLIGNHVIAAPTLKRSGLEIIPTGYVLVDSGKPTSVHYMSNTQPVPGDKPDIAACTALAGEQLGLKMIYMDGGSGAMHPVSKQMIRAVRDQVSIPLIVGGGIRSAKQADEIYRAGADMIVIGTAVEESGGQELLREISELLAIYAV